MVDGRRCRWGPLGFPPPPLAEGALSPPTTATWSPRREGKKRSPRPRCRGCRPGSGGLGFRGLGSRFQVFSRPQAQGLGLRVDYHRQGIQRCPCFETPLYHAPLRTIVKIVCLIFSLVLYEQKRNPKETIVYMLQQQLLRKRTESCCWQWPSGKELVDSNFPRMNFAGLFNFTSNQNSGFASP